MTAFDEKKDKDAQTPTRSAVDKRERARDGERPPEERPHREPKGTGSAREKVSDVNPIDTGERGTTGPAAL